jgi:hypothetical protein
VDGPAVGVATLGWIDAGTSAAYTLDDADELSFRLISVATGDVPGSGAGRLVSGTERVDQWKNLGVLSADSTEVEDLFSADLWTAAQRTVLRSLPTGEYQLVAVLTAAGYESTPATITVQLDQTLGITGWGHPSTYTVPIPDPAPAGDPAFKPVVDASLIVAAPVWSYGGVDIATGDLEAADTLAIKLIDATGAVVGVLENQPYTLAELQGGGVFNPAQPATLAIGAGLTEAQRNSLRAIAPGSYSLVITLEREIDGVDVTGQVVYDVLVTRPAEVLIGQADQTLYPVQIPWNLTTADQLSSLVVDIPTWKLNGADPAVTLLDDDILTFRVVDAVTGLVPGAGTTALVSLPMTVADLADPAYGILNPARTEVALYKGFTPDQLATIETLPAGKYRLETVIERVGYAATLATAQFDVTRQATPPILGVGATLSASQPGLDVSYIPTRFTLARTPRTWRA